MKTLEQLQEVRFKAFTGQVRALNFHKDIALANEYSRQLDLINSKIKALTKENNHE